MLTHNSEEFVNDGILRLWEPLNTILNTAPWTLVQWTRGKTKFSIVRNIEPSFRRSGCSLEITLASCLNAKDFSSFQLAIGQNPSLPCTFNDKFPAITSTNHGEFLRHYLTNIHKSRKAFIMNENSEKIRRALWHNIRTSNDSIFVSGNSVYYKCICGRRWRGPAAVLVKDGWKFKKLSKFEITDSLDSEVESCKNLPDERNQGGYIIFLTCNGKTYSSLSLEFQQSQTCSQVHISS